jgi:C4-dicarboxylate-binding protein DctP
MKLKCVVATLCAAISINVWAAAPEPIVIKFSHVVAPETAKGQAAAMFKKLAEQLTKGRVRVEVYPNSTLLKDKDEMAALQKGDVQMLAPSLAKFSGLGVKEFEVFDVPFIFPNKTALYKVMDGPIGKDLLKKLEPQGITGLTYWDNGFKDMSANKPLLVPADFAGLKMRIQGSDVIAAQMKDLGAVPKVINFAETYAALKSGAVDGTENPPTNMLTQKMNDVQSHMTVSKHGYLGYAVIVNKKFWDGLPADIRASLVSALAEATDFQKAYAQLDNDRAIAAIRKTGKTDVYVLSTAEQEQWAKALAPVQKQMAARIGQPLIDSINKVAASSR